MIPGSIRVAFPSLSLFFSFFFFFFLFFCFSCFSLSIEINTNAPIGSIRPIVENLDYTGATVRIKQRRAIENPFNSIHLAALVNFGELVYLFSSRPLSPPHHTPLFTSSPFFLPSFHCLSSQRDSSNTRLSRVHPAMVLR